MVNIKKIKTGMNQHGYFIEMHGDLEDEKNTIISSDGKLAEILGMHLIRYQDILERDFNAKYYAGPEQLGMYFGNREDARKAIIWFESILVANKLCEKGGNENWI